MKYAWVIDNVVKDICKGNPEEHYHPDVAKFYDTLVPDTAVNGAVLVDGGWVNPEEQIVDSTAYPQLSPLSFKMCFTTEERIAIKALKETDPIIADAFEILDDPRLKVVDLGLQSNRDLIDYLVSLNVLTADRATAVKQGTLL